MRKQSSYSLRSLWPSGQGKRASGPLKLLITTPGFEIKFLFCLSVSLPTLTDTTNLRFQMSPLHSEQCFEIYLLFDAIALLLKAVGVQVNLLFWSPTDSRLDCCHTRNCRVDWYEGFILQFGHLFWSCLMTVWPGLQTSICLDNKQCLLMFGDQTFSVGRA